jgi:hypothetical protein
LFDAFVGVHRVFSGIIKFMNQFSQDGVEYTEHDVMKLKQFADLMNEAGQAAPAKQLQITLETVCA